jgi:4-diphosphocytidyl-2-C-methyl-D-erythritol kinase
VSIPTASIFSSPLLVRDTKPAIVTGFPADTAGPEEWQIDGFGRNDLQMPAEAQEPMVKAAAEWLKNRFGHSRMTGSGSAVFAGAGTGHHPEATWSADELPPGWVGRMCRSLVEHPLRGWAG